MPFLDPVTKSSHVSFLVSKYSLTFQKIPKAIKKQFVLLCAITWKPKSRGKEKKKQAKKLNPDGPWTPSSLSTELINKRNLGGSFKTSLRSCSVSKRPARCVKQTWKVYKYRKSSKYKPFADLMPWYIHIYQGLTKDR